MRSYTVDELTFEQSQQLSQHLKTMQLQSSLVGVFWLPVPESLLSQVQLEHRATCGPYVMAFLVEGNHLTLQFLVQAQNAMHCQCVSYASKQLIMHMINYVDELLLSLEISV